MKNCYQKLFILPLFVEVCLSTLTGGVFSTFTSHCSKNNVQEFSQCSTQYKQYKDKVQEEYSDQYHINTNTINKNIINKKTNFDIINTVNINNSYINNENNKVDTLNSINLEMLLTSIFIFSILSILFSLSFNNTKQTYWVSYKKLLSSLITLTQLLEKNILLFLKQCSLFYCEYKYKFQFNQFYKHFKQLPIFN